jgi:death-on-curing protein
VSGPISHPSVAAVKAIHREVLRAHGGSGGIRDEALLESAIAAPQATTMGRPLISDPIEIAAAYLFYLCRNHPFIDGNKRTALASCLVFLETNGFISNPKLPTGPWERFVLDLASSRFDRAQTTARLRSLLRELKK